MDVSRRFFLKAIGLAGLAIPASSFININRMSLGSSEFTSLREFIANSHIRLLCPTVEQYLLYTQYCEKTCNIYTFDDPYQKLIGIVANLKGRSCVKLISIDIETVNAWIKEKNLDDSEFRKMVFMPVYDKKTKGRLKVAQDSFYASQEEEIVGEVSLADIKIDRHQGESDLYFNKTAKGSKNDKRSKKIHRRRR